MIRLKYKYDRHSLHYPQDVVRIVDIFADRGYIITYNDAARAWEEYSDGLCAGWLVLPDDDEEVFETVFNHFEEE